MAKDLMLNLLEKKIFKKNLTKISVFSQFFWKAILIETVYEYTRQLKENAADRRREAATERAEMPARQKLCKVFVGRTTQFSIGFEKNQSDPSNENPQKKLAKTGCIFVKMDSRFAFYVFKSNNKILKLKSLNKIKQVKIEYKKKSSELYFSFSIFARTLIFR